MTMTRADSTVTKQQRAFYLKGQALGFLKVTSGVKEEFHTRNQIRHAKSELAKESPAIETIPRGCYLFERSYILKGI